MDSKRKAAAATSPDGEGRASKRVKLPAGRSDGADTVEVGLKFVELLKQARDKNGRLISLEFLSLPDRKQLPQYYQEILLPTSIDTIEGKLKRGEYADISGIESDFKRMINNAKKFNEKGSLIYDDAERLRKTGWNFMHQHNPAHKDPNFSALPTPIPGENTIGTANNNAGPHASATQGPSERPRRAAAASQQPSQPTPSRSSAARDSVASGQEGDAGFAGKTFQEAQEQIMNELIKHKDEESGLEIFTPFVNLPSRTLTDYYALIKNPVSLRSVQKKVRGIHGRAAPTNITDLKSWDALEEEMSWIWRNAREYNEDGSEMYNLAGELENYFKQRLAEAKSKVEQPAQPTLKLKMSSAPRPSIKLKFGGQKDSPGPSSDLDTSKAQKSNTSGFIVDAGALERQQQHVQAGMNGQRQPLAGAPTQAPSSRNPFSGSRSGSSSTPIPSLNSHHADRRQSGSATSPPLASNGIKSETQPSQSPALNSIRPTSVAAEKTTAPTQTQHLAASAMPPPSTLTPRPPSGSPRPPSMPPQQSHGSNIPHSNTYYAPPSGVETKYRPPGKTAADALLPKLTITSHPSLHLPRPFSLTIPASQTLTQQSMTITLPSTHKDLQIIPSLPVALTTRPYRLFVMVNGYRVSETIPLGGAAEREKGRPLFDARLKTGEVNRIEVEVLAASTVEGAARGGAAQKGEKEEVEWEKCTVFVHLMR